MKKIILLFISTIVAICSYAFENQNANNKVNQIGGLSQAINDTSVVMLSVANLPQDVKNTVGNYEYSGWIAEPAAYQIMDNIKRTIYYKINLKNSDTGEKKILILNKEGEELK